MNEQATLIETFTELAPRYEEVVDAELDRFWGWSYTNFVNQLMRGTPIPKTGKMLDLATGTGVIPLWVAARGSGEKRIHGLDITQSMLEQAKKKISLASIENRIDLICASAMDIPYASESFDLVTCALATHHMDVPQLLSESWRVLRDNGLLSMADVGGSGLWKNPIVKLLLRLVAFLYFLLKENFYRAWIESAGVLNVRSKEEWFDMLYEAGFQNIKITKLKSKYRWIPEPLVIRATKSNPGGME